MELNQLHEQSPDPLQTRNPVAVFAMDAPLRTQPSNYPEPFASMMNGRSKRPLGDLFGLRNFGVNLTVLVPGAVSALRHAHTKQDEFVFVLSGELMLYTDLGGTPLTEGMCAGFRAGSPDAHRLANESNAPAVYIEVGDRTPGDAAVYPDDDLEAKLIDGKWKFFHKDGAPY